MSKENFKTKDGANAAHARETDWLEPSANPFGHGCCDCGLFHRVMVRIVDEDGIPVDMRKMRLQMKWGRDEVETLRLRAFMGK